jgi:hypothetical protein
LRKLRRRKLGERAMMNSPDWREVAVLQNLDDGSYVDPALGPTVLLVAAPNCMLKNVKAIELSRGGDSLTVQPVLLPIAAEETTLKTTVADICNQFDCGSAMST